MQNQSKKGKKMEINTQAQPNINTELLQKKPARDLNEPNTDMQNNAAGSVENAEPNTSIKNLSEEDTSVLVRNQNLSFKDQLNQLNADTSIYDFSLINEDFAGIFSFDVSETDEEDIKFFLDIIEKNKNNPQVQNINLIPIIGEVSQTVNTNETQSVQATEKIMQITEIASKTDKPVRIDFDNKITVVLRVDNAGKINAHFYPGDKAAEEYLRNNIQSLRNTFDEKNILYSYLDYKQNKGNNGKERKER